MYEVIVRIQQTRRTGATGAQLIKSLKRTFLKVGLYPFLMLICLLPGKKKKEKCFQNIFEISVVFWIFWYMQCKGLPLATLVIIVRDIFFVLITLAMSSLNPYLSNKPK
jgi:uncharacterized membrane protein